MEVTKVTDSGLVLPPNQTGPAPSIWGSVEVDAWARGCNYDQYVDWHTVCKCRGRLLEKDHYDVLSDLLWTIMDEDMK